MQDVTFANVSHELRTPLTVLQGYLEMMHDQELAGPLRDKALGTMQEQTKRMDGLVKQLLTLSRIEAAPNVDLNERVDIPLMLKILQHEVQALSNGRHEITFRVNDQLKVFGNEDQLRSAVSNLVYNAVNHTPEGTKIEVCWQQTPQGAQFQVSDNGPGILLSMFLALRSASIGSIKPGHGKRGAVGWGWQS